MRFAHSLALLAAMLAVLSGCAREQSPPPAAEPVIERGELPSVAWAALPAAGAVRAPMLSGGEQDPVRPQRRLTCKAGAANPGNGGEPPQLVITGDGVRTIALAGVELGAQADMSGCRAAALDAGHPDSFYVAGGGHNGAHGWQASPPPLHTADGGRSWHRIPAPVGYDQPGSFLGFQVNPDRVTAWFGRPESERIDAPAEIQGSTTTDGGTSWSTVRLACPEGAPCAWDLPASLFLQGHRGLWHSVDGGRTWEWAAWTGKRLWVLGKGFYRLSDGAIEVAGACVGGEFDKSCAPLLRSLDGGKTWQWVELPAPAGGWPREMEIALEPDGSLLGRFGPDSRRLERGKPKWQSGGH